MAVVSLITCQLETELSDPLIEIRRKGYKQEQFEAALKYAVKHKKETMVSGLDVYHIYYDSTGKYLIKKVTLIGKITDPVVHEQ